MTPVRTGLLAVGLLAMNCDAGAFDYEKLVRLKVTAKSVHRAADAVRDAESVVIGRGSPNLVVPHPGETLEAMLSRVCGQARAELVEQFHRLNPAGFPEEMAGNRFRPPVKVPACLYFETDASVTVEPEESIASVWERSTGTPYDESALRLLQGFPENANLAFGELPAGSRVTLPFVVKAVMIEPAVAQAVVQLGPSELGVATEEIMSAVPLSLESLSVADRQSCEDPDAIDPAVWPFPANDVRALVTRYSKLLEKQPANVVMIDTGFYFDVAKHYPLSHLPDPCPVDPVLNRRVGGRMHYGRCDVPPWDTDIEHGTQTASVAAGGRSFLEQPFDLPAPPIALRLYGLGLPGRPVASTDIGEALQAARAAAAAAGSFPIVNISYMTQDDYRLIADTFATLTHQEHQRELAIVAAGNSPSEDLDVRARPISPASYGREETWNVLTVGALRPDGRLLSSSKFGEYTVGIAAPGCGVLAQGKSTWGPVSGTSIAAPVVSFTAGLLRAEGLTSARRILHRLLVSATRNEQLLGYVREGRVLNVPDALTVFEDIVVTRKEGVETRHYGLIEATHEISPDRFVSGLTGMPVAAKVARIDRITLESPSEWRAVATFEDHGPGNVPLLRTKRMRMTDSFLRLTDRAGATQQISLGEVSHIIFRSIDLKAKYPDRAFADHFVSNG